ncbi:DUF4157 domain-containing protein [Aquimarina sp. D1M17]|uniref:eCIS core domain-containing protein n=1 Tax=Aquimarina acroporae TaxID=2937283 RepID=UPI0020BDFF4F|nr:DUF4157 domain-containing protein [Aquimarina acroporae]MCK8521026.1 DUF4157 domain-containing protein [Aquimarina acroporae]
MKESIENTQEPQRETVHRVEQELSTGGESNIRDNRPSSSIQRKLQLGIDGFTNGKNLIQRKNNTGLPDNLKSGIENLSGYSMDDVKVNYNSSKPAQLRAHAYAQGTDIHLAPGQEKHLPHEAWHVVQQKQGRVKPTMQFKGKVNINDDTRLEKEADIMGARSLDTSEASQSVSKLSNKSIIGNSSTYQLRFDSTKDSYKLEDIYDLIVEGGFEFDDLEGKIYNILGYQENSIYTNKESDRELVKDLRLKPQGKSTDILVRSYHKAKKSGDTEKMEVAKETFERVKNLKYYEIEDEDKERISELSYEQGNYFHIGRRKKKNEKVNERLIVNINSIQKAGELIKHIADGWDEKANDWRKHVVSGKFYATERLQKFIKYDKVVLYYDKRFQGQIYNGVKQYVPENDRNNSLSGFYNKLERGIGVGEELGGGTSFTGNRTDSLVKFIANLGLEKTREISKEEFVKRAFYAVQGGMGDDDLRQGNAEHTASIMESLDDFIENT